MKRAVLLSIPILTFVACHPARMPIVRRPLEIKGQTSAAPGTVKIGIKISVPDVTVTCPVPIMAVDETSGEQARWPAGSHHIEVISGIIAVDGKPRAGVWRLRPREDGQFIQCGVYAYRGDLVVKLVERKITVINELPIDDYLKGVLPREAVPTWAEEALKAQAVASRTYLASHLNQHASQGFDLCSDVHCQVYGGMTKEHPRTTAAVDDTRNEILIYGGKPISAFFHANCGGSTEKVSAVWGNADQPYLPRKRCEWGTAAPWYHWKKSFADEDILSSLRAKNLIKGTVLKSISIAERSGSGRAAKMRVRTDGGTFTMSGNDFRIAMNPEKIRSTKFTSVQRLRGGYAFAGDGWGHGVGMCQWGAKGQAEHGRSYRDILAFYYPSSEIALWSR
ncbi:MAG: SpoIID/LytB domain-containing protein [Elusimicrobia bacterium]|nr:SpoIID/LytB domain-containing protein [Elusimicrobiota bacterium]